ncbi:MAG: hypothetical protein L0L14_09275 [Tetragenococcus koreensis]|nr:hypothetical protein [Tetragenococcus koreensis]
MQLKHFVEVVCDKAEPIVTPTDNVKTLQTLTAIKQATETGQLIKLEK